MLQRKVHTVETVNEDLRKEDKAYTPKKYEMENLKQFLVIGMRDQRRGQEAEAKG